MTKTLRLGVAGLGVVGTSLIQLLQRRRAGFIARAGRACVLSAYSARHKRGRGVDLGDAQFFDSAVAMAASADIDVFVELIGGADGVAYELVKAALGARPAGRYGQQSDARRARFETRRAIRNR